MTRQTQKAIYDAEAMIVFRSAEVALNHLAKNAHKDDDCHPKVQFFQGRCYEEMGDKEKAMIAYKLAYIYSAE